MRCHVRIGRLISHPCARTTHRRCRQCGNPTCEKHRVGEGDCVVCTGEHAAPSAPASLTLDEMLSFSDEEVAAFDAPGSARAGKLQDHDS